jgi:hypothetical protein
MCSSAAVCMSIRMLDKRMSERQWNASLVHTVMLAASATHSHFGGQVTNVSEVLSHMGSQKSIPIDIKCVEYIVCENGCIDIENGEPTSVMIDRKLFTHCLEHRLPSSTVLTCGGHSVCVSAHTDLVHPGVVYSLFDPGPSFLMLDMNQSQLEEQLDKIVVDQCDITIMTL